MFHFVLVFLGAAALAGASVTAGAATTVVNSSGGGSGSERCLAGASCNGGAYNGALSLPSVFQNELIVSGMAGATLVRVDDDFDKIWTNAIDSGGMVQALARYAGDNYKLGFDAGGEYTTLTSVFHSKISSNTRFGVGSTGYANTSLPNLDYMVTFQVLQYGLPTQHYFIAREDRNPLLGNRGDFDYNDYIAKAKFATPVPEPEIYVMMLAGLGLMGFVARRRRQQANAA